MIKKTRKVLILTSSGGGGLLQAAVAKEQEERNLDPHVIIIKRDVVVDWYIKFIGRLGIRFYNYAQLKGNVAILEFLFSLISFGEWFFWPKIFYHSLKLLFKEDVDRIIDTQPLGTSAIIRALRIYNRQRNKRLVLEKVIVDLPTEKNTHFLRPIKALSDHNRKWLRVITIPPITEGGTADEFWRKNCNMPESGITYEYFAIRRAFLKIQGKKKEDKETSILVDFANSEEKIMFAKTIQRGALMAETGEKMARLFISPHDIVLTIMLGSQPAAKATLGYVEKFIELARETSGPLIHLFVFCGHHQSGLLSKVAEMVQKAQVYPSRLTVIPLGFQNDGTIAQVFYLSRLTCTRSGGQTAMELMCVMDGEIWIHSEAVKPAGQSQELSEDQLLKGIPRWEAGNAVYLCKLRQAKIVTPQTCLPMGRNLLNRLKK